MHDLFSGPAECQRRGGPRVVVFDFDLTLTRWDTASRFFRWLLWRNPWRLLVVFLALPMLGPLFLLRKARWVPIRFAVWVATFGRTLDSLPALVEEHIDSLPNGHASVMLPAAIEHLKAHLENGDQVVIATGCLQPLAAGLLERAGIGEVPLVASTLRPLLGGLVRDQHCFGQNKVPMLTAQGFGPPWDIAYTDHHSDLPVLLLSSESHLVSPKQKCLARIEQALSSQPSVLLWR